MSELNKKIVTATKWSAIAEIVAKLVMPIISMVLARLLTPEAFGIVATLTMVVSFAEIFTDAGFQKYLVQHEFVDDVDREQSTTVAFWSNFGMSMLIWVLIAIFSSPLARMVGNPGMGHVLTIACVNIPIAAFSSIQMALYKRDLDFKTLFKVRLVGVIVPLVVTIPLAFWLRSYWALVIGTIVQNFINAILLTAFSNWKPHFFYSISKLKEMLSFTIWSVIEAVSLWLTSYVDIFIVGTTLSQYYLGLYRTSSVIVGHIMGLITAIATPILFSSLSRLQKDRSQFETLFLAFQKYVGILVIPLGVGIYCYRDLVTEILLGNQWTEAVGFVGLWGLTSAVTIIFAHFASEVYRAKGRPKLSVLAQWLHIIVLWPVVLIAVKYDFQTLYVARSLVRLELITVNLIIMYFVVNISPWRMFTNSLPSMLSSISIVAVSYIFSCFSNNLVVEFVSVAVSTIFYFVLIMMFKEERNLIITKILKRK